MRLLIISFTIFFSLQGISQPQNLKGLDRDAIASYYIGYLRKGALLVRLKTKSRKIEILKRAGNIAAAEKVKKDQSKINKSIIKAFNDAFTFCPVHFFYSGDSKYVSAYQMDSITFLSDELHPLKLADPPRQFLVAEFGLVQEDTAKNYTGYGGDYLKDSSNVLKQNKQYGGGTNMSFGALIIKSDQFIQLSKPFPYYARTLATLPMLRRSHFKVVTIMNEKLLAFAGIQN